MNTSRFAADLNPEIGRGPRRKPAIDLRSAADVIPDGTPDPEVPQIAGQSGRVLVSRAIATMPDHFARFIVQHESPGVILIPSQRSIGAAIEGLLTVWLTVQVQQRSRFCAEGADAADSSTAAGFARATNARLQAPRDDYALCALNVLEGTVIGGCQPRHRHQEFLRFLSRIDQSIDPGLDVHQVFDNYGTHKHPDVKKWLAARPRYHVHFTPTGSSWLNQIERWFAEITRKRIRRGTFCSVRDLIKAIHDYIRIYNNNARPFQWVASASRIIRKVNKYRQSSETGV